MKKAHSQIVDQPDISPVHFGELIFHIGPLQRRHQHQQQRPARQDPGDLQPAVFLWLGLRVEVHQHKYEKEQHHNGPRIHDQVYDRQELGVQ